MIARGSIPRLLPVRYGWSLERTDWSDARPLLSELRWRRVWLRVPDCDSVPVTSGIYAICTPAMREGDGLAGRLYNVLYVGQAISLRNRFLQHSRNPARELRRALSCFDYLDYWFCEVDAILLNQAERRLISVFGPSVNIQGGIRGVIGEPRPAGAQERRRA